MVAMNIEIIHGDMLVKNMRQNIGEGASQLLTVEELLDRYPAATNITLKAVLKRPVYVVELSATTELLDARSPG